jgi:SsrA-binding protein
MEAIINKKARFNFSIEDTYEAGIVLEGWEVKPILARKINLDASHVVIKDDELFLLNAQVIPEKTTNSSDTVEATRTRKLLLKKSQIMQLIGKVQEKGYTVVITKVYRNRNKIKVEVALAKGKKAHDKREAIKERDWAMEQSQMMKKSTRA